MNMMFIVMGMILYMLNCGWVIASVQSIAWTLLAIQKGNWRFWKVVMNVLQA